MWQPTTATTRVLMPSRGRRFAFFAVAFAGGIGLSQVIPQLRVDPGPALISLLAIAAGASTLWTG